MILAGESKDDHVLVAVVDPDPEHYYFKEFGYYNWINLPIHLSGGQYWDAINEEPDDSPADSIFVNSYIIVWTSSSKNWAVLGDRNSGVCILATKGLQCSIFIQNKLGDPEKAEALLEKGDADLVAVGTSALVNPDWANKVREGDPLKPFI